MIGTGRNILYQKLPVTIELIAFYAYIIPGRQPCKGNAGTGSCAHCNSLWRGGRFRIRLCCDLQRGRCCCKIPVIVKGIYRIGILRRRLHTTVRIEGVTRYANQFSVTIYFIAQNTCIVLSSSKGKLHPGFRDGFCNQVFHFRRCVRILCGIYYFLCNQRQFIHKVILPLCFSQHKLIKANRTYTALKADCLNKISSCCVLLSG